MYPQHFQLDSRLFAGGPGSQFFVPNKQVAAAVDQLQEGLLSRDAVVLISGGPGVGKTALLEHARSRIGDEAVIAWADLRQNEPEQLFDLLLLSLGEEAGDGSGSLSWHRLRKAVQQHNEAGRRVTAAVDVSAITAERAKRLLRLAYLMGEPGAQLNLVLQGPHTLHKLLDVPGLIHLRQRMVFRHRVRPLSQTETTDYIVSALRQAGGDPGQMLDARITGRIFHYVAGVPRLINTLVDATLTAAAVSQADQLAPELVDEVAQRLGWKPLGGSARAAAATPSAAKAVAAKPEAIKLPATSMGARPLKEPGPINIDPGRTGSPSSSSDKPPITTGSNTSQSEMTAALLAPIGLSLDLARDKDEAEKPKAAESLRPPPGVPEMDPLDTSATGMLRLEDLDDRFAETVFGADEDSAA